MSEPSSRSAALLLLGDGRFPSGGYAHSGGLEPTVLNAGVTDAASLKSFLAGRASTVGFMAASFAAAARETASAPDGVLRLDAELDARMPSPVSRSVSRTLGRQLLRALAGVHPHAYFEPLEGNVHQANVYGVAAAAFGLSARDVTGLVLHETVAGPAAAAVKVLATDPFTVNRAFAELTALVDELADAAAAHCATPPADLPAIGSPLLDLAAEQHGRHNVRLFAS